MIACPIFPASLQESLLKVEQAGMMTCFGAYSASQEAVLASGLPDQRASLVASPSCSFQESLLEVLQSVNSYSSRF